MTYSFNLIDKPWIPCAQMDGHVVELSLHDVLAKAHELRGIQGDSPLETASLYRLLLAVLHSVLRGPPTKSEWKKLWNAKQFEMNHFDKYFKQWHSHFDLFDAERPFYQVKSNKDGREKTSNDVIPDVASATNATLFSHSFDKDNIALSPAKATHTLLVMQTFSVAGGWGMAPRESSDAPWGRGVIFLTEDNNLFNILLLNLFRYPDKEVIPYTNDDMPAWEMKDSFKPKREIPLGYLDLLTWQNRRVSLIPEGDPENPIVKEMVISQGLKLDSTALDPMKHYRIDEKKGHLVHRFSEDKSIWRDSAALFKVHNSKSVRPPQAFYWLANLAENESIDKHQVYRFMALGMATKGDAKIDFYRHESFPLPLEYLNNDDLVEKLSKALGLAEDISRVLWVSGNRMAVLIVSPTSDGKKWAEIGKLTKEDANKLYQHWGAERLYWSQLEVPFNDFIYSLPVDSESALKQWIGTLRQTAENALASAERMAGESANALKAAVRANGVLRGELKKLFGEIQPQQEVKT